MRKLAMCVCAAVALFSFGLLAPVASAHAPSAPAGVVHGDLPPCC